MAAVLMNLRNSILLTTAYKFTLLTTIYKVHDCFLDLKKINLKFCTLLQLSYT